MLKVLADQEFSRRKRFHHIIDGDGNVLRSFTTICEVFDWLSEQGETIFVLKTEEDIYKVDISARWE